MSKQWPELPDDVRRIYAAAVVEHGKPHAVTALVREYGIGDRTLRRRLAAAGVLPTRKRMQRPTDGDLCKLHEALTAEHGERQATAKIAERFGVSFHTAWRWLSEAEIRTVTPALPRQRISGQCPCGALAVTRYASDGPPLCMNCYHKARRKDPNAKPHRRNGRLTVAEFKKGKPCADCGGLFPPYVLDFDHVPERGPKRFHLGQPDRNLKEVMEELAKCDLVCANCHRIRTWKRRHASEQP